MPEARQPKSIALVDAETLPGFHRARWILVTAFAFVILGAIVSEGVFLAQTTSQLGSTQTALIKAFSRLEASCNFFKDIGEAALPSRPKPTHLSARFVADSRIAYDRQGCPGKLAQPSPAMRHWFRIYHIQY